MSTTVLIKVTNPPIITDRTALKEVCGLRKWCYNHINNGWCSYFLNTTDDNKLNGIGFVAFEFDDPKECMKFRLMTGGI